MTSGETAAATAPDRLAFETSYRVRFDEAGPGGQLRTSGFMRAIGRASRFDPAAERFNRRHMVNCPQNRQRFAPETSDHLIVSREDFRFSGFQE